MGLALTGAWHEMASRTASMLVNQSLLFASDAYHRLSEEAKYNAMCCNSKDLPAGLCTVEVSRTGRCLYRVMWIFNGYGIFRTCKTSELVRIIDPSSSILKRVIISLSRKAPTANM